MKNDNEYGIGKPLYTLSDGKESSKLEKVLAQLKKGVIPLVSFVSLGLFVYGNLPEKVETRVLDYQGYYPDEGKEILVFDPKPVHERKGEPKYKIVNDIKDVNLDNFEINKKYRVEIVKPNFSLFPEKVVSMKEELAK